MTPPEHKLLLRVQRAFWSSQLLQRLSSSLKDWQSLLDCDVADLQALGCTASQARQFIEVSSDEIEQDVLWLDNPNHHLLSIFSEDYPTLLAEIFDPPPVLLVVGDVQILNQPQLAIVGSRNPTQSGKRLAYDFAAELARAGLVVTSGMALGVDACAHQGALAVESPTIAVWGTGLDRVYPARHRELAQQIAQCGALVSEFPLGTSPKPHHFPKRNRIISGLSVGTLVVEAAPKSGSLITAYSAIKQGREVFAIPGSIHNPLARGCHQLIKQGAKLVETSAEILEELPQLAALCTKETAPKEKVVPQELSTIQIKILETIDFHSTSVESIIAKTSLSAEQINTELLLLELSGSIESVPGGYCRL